MFRIVARIVLATTPALALVACGPSREEELEKQLAEAKASAEQEASARKQAEREASAARLKANDAELARFYQGDGGAAGNPKRKRLPTRRPRPRGLRPMGALSPTRCPLRADRAGISPATCFAAFSGGRAIPPRLKML